jgi:ATP phosphoribosyltransferase
VVRKASVNIGPHLAVGMESPMASPIAKKFCWEDSTSCMPAFTPAFFPQNNKLLFGVPKKGRIHQEVMTMLKGAGIDAKKPDRLDVADCKELGITLVFLPAADIPRYVMEGNVDIGISGSDMIEEVLLEAGKTDESVEVLMKLGIGKCKLCLQAPVNQCSKPASEFAGKRIVTSFPHVTAKFFQTLDADKGLKQPTPIRTVSGSVEAACSLGLADAVVDLVETGTTMKAAGLDVVADVLETEAVLFTRKPVTNGLFGNKVELISLIQQRIKGYLTSTRYVMVSCNCHADSLTQVCDVLPGKRSTTVTALKEVGWHAASGLVPMKEVHSTMDKLTSAGAVDILCLNLSNTRIG